MRVRQLLAFLLLSLCALQAQAVRELRMGSPWPTATVLHVGAAEFVKEVETLSKGELKIKLYPDAQLGDIQALVTGTQTGTIDLTFLGPANASVLKGGSALNVVYVPYLFKNRDVVEKVINGPLFEPIYEELAKESSVRIFGCYGARLPRGLLTVKGPIVKPADLKGIKMRTPPIEVMRGTWEKLGTKPVIMGMSDIYMSMTRGQVEGQENGLDAIIGFKWYEVAKFYSNTDHVFDTAAYYAHEKVWQSLTPAQRDILKQAAKNAGAALTKAMTAYEKEALNTLKKNGVTITQPDQAAFREQVKDLYKKYEGKLWPEGFVDQIRAAENK
jgi:tripartite ATP-independent transporter DctP family solute receptor